VKRRYFRGAAAFANLEICEFHEAESMGYAIRLPANRVLQERIGCLLKRPVGRSAHEVRRYYGSFSHQAQSWKKPRLVVAKIEWYPGELYPRIGFIVTNLARPAERVVAFYNQRGTAEPWIKEGNGAIKWTACRVALSPPMPCVLSSTPSPTTWAISCGCWRYPRRLGSAPEGAIMPRNPPGIGRMSANVCASLVPPWEKTTPPFFRTVIQPTESSRRSFSVAFSVLGSRGIGARGSKSFGIKRVSPPILVFGRASSRAWRSAIISCCWLRPIPLARRG
jgi:hypothetical protein